IIPATSSAIACPPTPALPHKGGGSQKSPPPLWGRVGWGARETPRQDHCDNLLRHPPRATAEKATVTMRITWYGHAAFLIESGGLRMILDPYRSPDSGGYEPIGEPADLVVVSHDNDRYHSHLGQLVPPFELIRALEHPAGGPGIPRPPVRVGARLREPPAPARGRGDHRPLPRRGDAPGLPRRSRPSAHRGGNGSASR